MQFVSGPITLYMQGLKSGQFLVLVSSTSYLVYWLVFLALGAAAYAVTSRMAFSDAMARSLPVSFGAAAAQLVGALSLVVTFYLVFFFSPARVEAWLFELTLLAAWFLFFLLTVATAPSA